MAMSIADEREMQESYRKYCSRKELCKSFGYDMEQERCFIIDKAMHVHGDLLEVGTGKGYLAIELARRGYRFTSIDADPESIRIAGLNLKYFGLDGHVKIERQSAEELSFKDGSFTTVLMVNTLHHLERPYRVLSELIRVVSLNGKIVISDFTEEGFSVMDEIHAREGGRHDKGKVGLKEIENYFLGKGLKVERFKSRFQEVLIIRFGNTQFFGLLA